MTGRRLIWARHRKQPVSYNVDILDLRWYKV